MLVQQMRNLSQSFFVVWNLAILSGFGMMVEIQKGVEIRGRDLIDFERHRDNRTFDYFYMSEEFGSPKNQGFDCWERRERHMLTPKQEEPHSILHFKTAHLPNIELETRGNPKWNTKHDPIEGQLNVYIFVLSPENKMYIENNDHVDTDCYHHESFLNGGPILMAGEFTVYEGGKVIFTSKSGHYEPCYECLSRVIEYFEAQGLNDNDMKNWYFEDTDFNGRDFNLKRFREYVAANNSRRSSTQTKK